MLSVYRVVAGVFQRGDDILLSRRLPKAAQGGLWEFPGGKIERDESACAALAREWREELGVKVLRATPRLSVWHAYPDKYIRLTLYRIHQIAGEPTSCEGQHVSWQPIEKLVDLDWPAANRVVIDRYLPL